MTIPCSPGDKLGYIQRHHPDGRWELFEETICSISVSKNGIRIGKTKHFYSQNVEHIVANTELFKSLKDSVLVHEIFFLDDQTREKAERWIKWANEQPDEVRSILDVPS